MAGKKGEINSGIRKTENGKKVAAVHGIKIMYNRNQSIAVKRKDDKL